MAGGPAKETGTPPVAGETVDSPRTVRHAGSFGLLSADKVVVLRPVPRRAAVTPEIVVVSVLPVLFVVPRPPRPCFSAK